MKQKISMFLCVVLLLGSLSVVGAAAEITPSVSLNQKEISGETWYEISSTEDFYAIATVGSDKNYALTSDAISLKTAEGYVPIAAFSGTLIGCDKAAFDAGTLQEESKSITLELSGTANNVGVFASAGEGFSIRNIQLNGTVRNTGTYTGALFGIIGCAGELRNCVNACNVSGANYTGGLVGSYAGATKVSVSFEKVINHGDISGGTGVGGIFGNCRHSIVMDRAFNAGTIRANGTDHAKNPGAGGLIGGLKLGWSNSVTLTLQNAFNAAPVSNGAGNAYAGALIGNQVNAANLTVTNTVTNCYNAAENVALFGTEVAGTKTNLYTIGDSTDFSAGILTDSDMKKAESFNGFDFDAIWEMNTAGSDYSYPQLVGNSYLCTTLIGEQRNILMRSFLRKHSRS